MLHDDGCKKATPRGWHEMVSLKQWSTTSRVKSILIKECDKNKTTVSFSLLPTFCGKKLIIEGWRTGSKSQKTYGIKISYWFYDFLLRSPLPKKLIYFWSYRLDWIYSSFVLHFLFILLYGHLFHISSSFLL